MKKFISTFGCLFIASFIVQALKLTGISLGAIGIFIIYSLALSIGAGGGFIIDKKENPMKNYKKEYQKSVDNLEKRILWRNSSNIIECPGKSCPRVCNDTCPISLYKEATRCASEGKKSEAIGKLNQAIQIEKEYKSAWLLSAELNDEMGNSSTAKYCYEMAKDLVDDNAGYKDEIEMSRLVNASDSHDRSIEKVEKYLFCRKCGKKIPLDSIFCNACGEKVITVSDDIK